MKQRADKIAKEAAIWVQPNFPNSYYLEMRMSQPG